MSNAFKEHATIQNKLTNQMHFKTRCRAGTPDTSQTPETMEDFQQAENTHSWNWEDMITLLKDLLNEII